MSNWVYIENNEIAELHESLPNSWNNISGLSTAIDDLPFLKSLGWYPVTKTPYDEDIYVASSNQYTIREDDVLETPVLEEKEKRTLDQRNADFLKDVRAKRDEKLKECDWTQLADIQSPRTQAWKNTWSTYRQSLRDLPNTYINNSFSVSWPTPPTVTSSI